jgi:hypothetical protein
MYRHSSSQRLDGIQLVCAVAVAEVITSVFVRQFKRMHNNFLPAGTCPNCIPRSDHLAYSATQHEQ